MLDRLEKLLNLLKRTKEKVVFSDSSNFDDFYVILALKDYERLLGEQSDIKGLTGVELVDKINRDIAVWKNQEENQDFDLNYNDFDLEKTAQIEDLEPEANTAPVDNVLSKQDDVDEIEEEVEAEIEEERIEEIIDDGFDSVANILASRQIMNQAIESGPKLSIDDVSEDTDRSGEDDSNKSWSIPKDRKVKAEEVKETKEDKQYLEEITF